MSLGILLTLVATLATLGTVVFAYWTLIEADAFHRQDVQDREKARHEDRADAERRRHERQLDLLVDISRTLEEMEKAVQMAVLTGAGLGPETERFRRRLDHQLSAAGTDLPNCWAISYRKPDGTIKPSPDIPTLNSGLIAAEYEIARALRQEA